MMTSHLLMGNEEVRQPQRREVIGRRVGVRKAESLLGGGIRNREAPTSSMEVVLVV